MLQVFQIPHANPVPGEVIRLYYNSKETYMRKRQLREQLDGRIFLKRSTYREEDDDDDVNEKNNLAIFEKDEESNHQYIKAITIDKLVQRLMRPMIGRCTRCGGNPPSPPTNVLNFIPKDSYYDYVVLLMHPSYVDSTVLFKMFTKRMKLVSDYGPLSNERKAFNKLCRLR